MIIKMETKDLREQQTTPSKYVGLGASMAAELMIGLISGLELKSF